MTVLETTELINKLLPEPHAGLLAGMLFGVKATLDPQMYEDLVRTGTLHIIALSGMNISILISLVSVVFLRVVGRRLAGLLTIALIAWFVSFVGPSASVVRAAVMGSISLLATIFGRQNWALWSWVVTVSGMIVLNPPYVTDLSFQLSVMATLGLLLFGPKGGKPKFPMDDLRVTLSAQVFTTPIILFAFHRISLIAPLTNMLIGWVIPGVTGAGLAMVLTGLVWLPLAQIIAWVLWVPLAYILLVITVFSRIPGASLGW